MMSKNINLANTRKIAKKKGKKQEFLDTYKKFNDGIIHEEELADLQYDQIDFLLRFKLAILDNHFSYYAEE